MGNLGQKGGLDSRLYSGSQTFRSQHPPEGEQHLPPLAPKSQQGPRPKGRPCRPPAERRRAATPPCQLQTRLQRQGEGLGEGLGERVTATLLKPPLLLCVFLFPKVSNIFCSFVLSYLSRNVFLPEI